jgi:hypothetical protein
MIKFGRNSVKCSGKNCPTNAAKTEKGKDRAPDFVSSFAPPPIVDDSFYEDGYEGYFPPDFEE